MVIKWINRIVTYALLLVFFTFAFYVVSAKITGSEPKIFGYQLLTVLSGSMEPAIQTGSIIAIRPTENTDDYSVGDVITFRSSEDPTMLITHRIVDVEKSASRTAYITKGDNNASRDNAPVPADHVIGKYAHFTIPYVGYALSFLKTKWGLALLLIVPGVSLIAYQLVSLWLHIMRMDEKDAAAKEPHA